MTLVWSSGLAWSGLVWARLRPQRLPSAVCAYFSTFCPVQGESPNYKLPTPNSKAPRSASRRDFVARRKTCDFKLTAQLCHMLYAVWCMVYGVWCMVYAMCLEPGPSSVKIEAIPVSNTWQNVKIYQFLFIRTNFIVVFTLIFPIMGQVFSQCVGT